MDKRVDPWGDFLRRLLLSASLAGTTLPATAAEDAAPVEVAEPDLPARHSAAAEPAEG
jgi:hypothetical protein